MPEVSYPEALQTHFFSVEIDGQEVRITKVAGLSVTVESAEQVDGGSTFVRKVAVGPAKHEDITITRYVDGTEEDDLFRDLFGEVFQLNGTSGGSQTRHNIAIVKRAPDGTEKKRILVNEAWIKQYKFADLEAGSTNLYTLEVVLAHDGWEEVA